MSFYSTLIKGYNMKIDRIKVIILGLREGRSAVITGSFGSGKTTLLNELSSKLNLPVNHVSEINHPFVVGRGILPPRNGLILVDEASRYEPGWMCPRGWYRAAVVATHDETGKIGEEYVERLTGRRDLDVYRL